MGDQREREREGEERLWSPPTNFDCFDRESKSERERNEPAKLAEGRKRSDIPNYAAAR